MKDPRNGLSLPVVQDWPGSGTAEVGFGAVGGLVWDHNGQPAFARQNKTKRLVNRGTHQVAQPIQPVDLFGSYASSNISNISIFLKSMGAAGISTDFLIAETYDTANAMSSNVIDPQIGQRIYEVDPSSGLFAYADDNYVFLADEEDNIVRTVDLCSPVLQLDKYGLVRTRCGLATIDGNGGVEYLRKGSFMHTTSKGDGGEEVLATSTGGTIMLFDVETNTRKWKQTMSRGSMSRWSRVIGLENPATILWCNRYEMALVDLRLKPRNRQKALSILHYSNRQTEIRGVDPGFERGNDVFALTSSEVLWLSATPSRPMHPVLSVKHLLSNEDTSMDLYRGSYAGNDLVTVCSQVAPVTAVGCFGRTDEDNLPISTKDLYFMNSWPTIIPQSHMTRQTPQGVDLYTVSRNGGLFKQSWADPTDDPLEELLDLPPPDPLPGSNCTATVHAADGQLKHKDYDLLDIYEAVKPYSFQWLYRWAFKPIKRFQSEDQTEPSESVMEPRRQLSAAGSDAQFWMTENLRDHLKRAWLDPLEEKSTTSEVHPHALNVRRRTLNMIMHDALKMGEVDADETQSSLENTANSIELPPVYKQMVKNWQMSENQQQESCEPTSQPIQMPYASQSSQTQSSQTQPMAFASSFSQPTPGLPSLKVSKKHSGVKKSSKKKKNRH